MSFTNKLILVLLIIIISGIVLFIAGIKKKKKTYICISMVLFLLIGAIIYMFGRFIIIM